MKNLLSILLLTLLGTTGLHAQKGHSCCDPSAPEAFASLANSKDFRNQHELPVTYTLENAKGESITFPTSDGKEGLAYFVKAEETTNKYIFVFHEWWGLNDHIRREADRLNEELGVNVIALDLYDGKVGTTREEAGALMKANNPDRSKIIINGALIMAGTDAKIATIGWCFGGGWSLQAALVAGEQTVGCNLYYGMPESDIEKLKTLNGPTLAIFAANDKWINTEVVAGFDKNMRKANKYLDVEVYEADHAFANPSSSRYNEEAAQDAFQKSLTFLKEVFE